MGNIVKLLCGHEGKRVVYRVTMSAAQNGEAYNAVTTTFDVCPRCYQQKKRTKKFMYAHRGTR